MQFEISTPNGTSDRLKASLQRQLDFKLSSYDDLIHHVEARLNREPGTDVRASYGCTIIATLNDGSQRSATTRGPQPNICIADAASRLARTVARESKFPGAAWRAQSNG